MTEHACSLSYQISSLSRSCFLIFVNFAVSVLILISKLHAISTVHCKLDYCNSLYYNLPKPEAWVTSSIHVQSCCKL